MLIRLIVKVYRFIYERQGYTFDQAKLTFYKSHTVCCNANYHYGMWLGKTPVTRDEYTKLTTKRKWRVSFRNICDSCDKEAQVVHIFKHLLK